MKISACYTSFQYWSHNKAMDVFLRIRDSHLAKRFNEHRMRQFMLPFAFFWVVEVLFMVFRTYQTQVGAGDWDLTTGAKPLTPDKDSRFLFAMAKFGGYLAILLTFIVARTWQPKAYHLLCPMIVLNVNVYQYLYMPFSPKAPREFMLWSILLILRQCCYVTVFQMNGLFDIAFNFVTTVAVIIARTFVLLEEENIVWLTVPIVTAVLGMFTFQYMVSYEQKSLFLLERMSSR